MNLVDLTRQHERARALRALLDRLIHRAERRLAGGAPCDRPHNADWAWRPDLFVSPLIRNGVSPAPSATRLGDITLFHDCGLCEVAMRQRHNRGAGKPVPFGLHLDVFGFSGSFLSLVVDLPDEGVQGLDPSHIVTMTCLLDPERPAEIYARLNVKHGPNVEPLVQKLPVESGQVVAEFDLGHTRFDPARVEKVWVDLIFKTPGMNHLAIRDMTFSRRPRAEV